MLSRVCVADGRTCMNRKFIDDLDKHHQKSSVRLCERSRVVPYCAILTEFEKAKTSRVH
jgi:hypothetical protein